MTHTASQELKPPFTAGVLSRGVLAFYLATLALLPWSWFPPFPWLHEHAQWSDATFAITAAFWAAERWRAGRWPRLRLEHLAIALYLVFAALSLLFAARDRQAGALKLLGIAELCALALITSDLASRPPVLRLIARVIAATSLAVAAAAVAGLLLHYAGTATPLIGIYGELQPSRLYARVQAGLYNPNLLASFSIFAAAVVSRDKRDLPPLLRRAALVALSITVLLTFSRGILGFLLAAAIRAASTPAGRKIAVAFAAISTAVILSLTLWSVSLNPVSPFDLRVNAAPSSRHQAITSSLATLVGNPLWGSGPGTHPGQYRGGPFDAHLTPLNIAATLGLPALIAFTSIFSILWSRRSRPTNLALWGGLAGLALDALAQDIEDFRHLWVMIGLASASALKAPPPIDLARK